VIKEEHSSRPQTFDSRPLTSDSRTSGSRTTVDSESTKPPKANSLSLNQLLNRWGYKEAKYPIEESKFEEEKDDTELTDQILPVR
jgi:hypothetical protein